MSSLVRRLRQIIRYIDNLTEVTGKLVSWLALAMMVVTCLVVFLRYVLESSSIAVNESITYFHATLFMLGIAFTLKHGGHVRVDIFYRGFSARTQSWVDLLGGLLFLIPLSLLILILSWDYVAASWAIRESSKESQGLPWVYLLKTLLLIMPVSLLLQGIAEVLRNTLNLAGYDDHSEFQYDENVL